MNTLLNVRKAALQRLDWEAAVSEHFQREMVPSLFVGMFRDNYSARRFCEDSPKRLRYFRITKNTAPGDTALSARIRCTLVTPSPGLFLRRGCE